MSIDPKLSEVRKHLNTISPSFCAAKWYQVTLHLQNGHTHSCHHPATHKVPLNELKQNPSALHNTYRKKRQRREMLSGQRPKECEYCWKIEDASKVNMSDRILKSSQHGFFDKLKEQKLEDRSYWENTRPLYLEVSFGNECNFKCAYCAPHISSTLWSEIEKFGDYPTKFNGMNLDYLRNTGQAPIPSEEYNPYISAFWKWFPEIYDGLNVLRVTGGEPLINKNIDRLLDYLKENPAKEMSLAINSNLGIPKSRLISFCKKLEPITGSDKKVKDFMLFTSLEAKDEKAEFIRYGLNYKTFFENVRYYLKNTNGDLCFMSTFNILSLTSFKEFLTDFLEIRKEFGHNRKIVLDLPYLNYPGHLNIKIMRESDIELFKDLCNFANQQKQTDDRPWGLDFFELKKFERLYNYVRKYFSEWNEQKELEQGQHRADFYRFIKEYEKRKNLDFNRVFPEMKDFLKVCKKASKKH